MKTVNCLGKDIEDTVDDLLAAALDVTAPQHIDITIDEHAKVVWINVNGVCLLRACRISRLDLSDGHTSSTAWSP